jgi:hypothetical protein
LVLSAASIETANPGPLDLRSAERDAIAQVVVATISGPPARRKSDRGMAIGQRTVGGAAAS